MSRHYTHEEKLHAIALFQSGYGSASIGHTLGITPRRIAEWLRQYRTTGHTGQCPGSQKPYPAELKESVVHDVFEKHVSCETAALKYGVSKTSVFNWVKQVQTWGYASLFPSGKRTKTTTAMGRPRKKEP